VFQQREGENERLLVVVFQQRKKGERAKQVLDGVVSEMRNDEEKADWRCFGRWEEMKSTEEWSFSIVKISSAAQQCFSIVES
jgi:hypothetical protein